MDRVRGSWPPFDGCANGTRTTGLEPLLLESVHKPFLMPNVELRGAL